MEGTESLLRVLWSGRGACGMRLCFSMRANLTDGAEIDKPAGYRTMLPHGSRRQARSPSYAQRGETNM